MRIKVKKHRRGMRICGESAGGEELLYGEAECAKEVGEGPLLPFSYRQKGKGYRFVYHSGLARPLPEVLSTSLSRDHFESMLISFLDLAQGCEDLGLSLQRVSFQAHHIFFDPSRYSLRFLYLPVRGHTEPLSSPLEALKELAKAAKLPDGRARTLADRVLDHALRSPLFSWADYEGFLHEQGVLETRARDDPMAALLDAAAPCKGDRRDQYGFDFMGVQGALSTAAPKPPCLFCLEDGAVWPLKEGSTMIGSAAVCDIRLQGIEGLSRKHAAFQLTTQGCQLMDLDSTNGVKLNGKRIPAGVPVTVHEGDRIHLARALFTLGGVPC